MSFFKDKVAIVTGSASGIGRTIATELCKRGAKVIINDIDAEKIKQVVAQFRSSGYEAAGCLADVTVYADCENLIATAMETYGRIDILVNNAGVAQSAFFRDMTQTAFRRIFEICSFGAMFPTKVALEEIIRNKGSIIFISSVAGLYATASASAYAPGKMALTAFAQTLRLELDDTGVHIGLVFPAFIKNDPEKLAYIADGTPIPLPPRPTSLQVPQTEVAKAVLRSIEFRKKRIVISFIGKLTDFIATFYPGLLHRVFLASQKRFKKMYN